MYGRLTYGSDMYGTAGDKRTQIVSLAQYAFNNDIGDLLGTIPVSPIHYAYNPDIGSLLGTKIVTATNYAFNYQDAKLLGTLVVESTTYSFYVATATGIGYPFPETIIIVHDYNSKIIGDDA